MSITIFVLAEALKSRQRAGRVPCALGQRLSLFATAWSRVFPGAQSKADGAPRSSYGVGCPLPTPLRRSPRPGQFRGRTIDGPQCLILRQARATPTTVRSLAVVPVSAKQEIRRMRMMNWNGRLTTIRHSTAHKLGVEILAQAYNTAQQSKSEGAHAESGVESVPRNDVRQRGITTPRVPISSPSRRSSDAIQTHNAHARCARCYCALAQTSAYCVRLGCWEPCAPHGGTMSRIWRRALRRAGNRCPPQPEAKLGTDVPEQYRSPLPAALAVEGSHVAAAGGSCVSSRCSHGASRALR